MEDDLQLEFSEEQFYFARRRPDPVALVGGIGLVLLMLVLLVSLPIIARAGGFGTERKSPFDQEPFEYVEARLLKYGQPKEEQALPDRVVPALPTAPEEVLPLDRKETKPEPPKRPEKKKERQQDAVSDDRLREVFDRARAFAEVQDDYIPEGHPDGVPEGDVTDPDQASVGDMYAYRIKRIFLQRFVVPTLLGEGELKSLKAKIQIKVDIDMTIVSNKFLRRSGNPLFDDAVQNAVERVQLEVRQLPEPPEAIASRIFGGGFNFTFHGREASYE